jgi:hypothetical protein
MSMSALSKAVREVYVTIADQLRNEGRMEGRASAWAEGVLRVLDHRTWPISDSLRERVLATVDEQILRRWFARALTAGSLEEVFERLDA